jgi:O-antigen/teichoic acid export membrane protein
MSISLVIKVCSLVAGLILQVVLARILGVQEFGVYAFVWATFLSVGILGKLGLELASIRFVADYRVHGKWALLKGFLQHSSLIVFVASAVIGGVSLFVLNQMRRFGWEDSNVISVFALAMPLLPFYSLSELNAGVLRGLNRLAESLLTQNVVFQVLLASLMLVRVPFAGDVTAKTAIKLSYFALLLTLMVQYWLIHQFLPEQVGKARVKYSPEWVRVSLAMMVSSGIDQSLRQIGVIVIGIFIGTTQSGIYAVAARFARLVNVGLQISNQSTAHMLTPLYAQKRDEELQKVVSMTALATMLTTVPIVVVLLIWPSTILAFFGKAFAVQGVLAFRILLVGQLVNSLSGPNGLLMNMTDYQNDMLRILLLTLVVNLGFLPFFVPMFGVAGVALATTLAICFRNVVATIRILNRLGINTTIFSRYVWSGWRQV